MKNIVNRALVAKKKQFLSKAVPRGTRTIWRYLGALILLFSLGIGQMWAGVITAAATTDLGKSSTPRYVVNVDGVGRLMKNATGSSSWTLSNSKYLQTGSSKFALQTYNEISSIVITGYGTGSNRTFSSIKVGTTTSNYADASATGSGTMSSTESAQTITITPSSNIAANSYVEITLSGNVNIASVELVEAGGGSDVCPETLTISSKDSKTAFTEGEKVELTAALAKGNGDISYQWYKGGVAPANAITGATTNKLTINSCAVSDAGDYYCVASKTSCDNVTSSKFAITVEADTKCFNMPLITSKPANLASVIVTGGTLTDANAASKAIEFDAKGLKFGGSAARLKVTLSSASIVEGTKITVTYECTSDKGSGIAIYNGDHASKTMDESVSGKGSGSWEHTFTAAEAANYADEFMIDRNGGGGTMIVRAITVEDCGPAVTKHTITLNYNDGATPDGSLKVVDGNAAVKPADPTRGKYTFLGWFVGDTDTEYVWSTAVTDDITLKAHWQDPWTLTFDADGGSEVADVTVKHNTKAEKPADPTKDDNDFLGWFYGDPAVAFDWDANVTQNYALVAHWESAVAKYDVEYYDGDTKIGTEPQVWATGHPTAAGINTNKPLYTFVGWYTSSTLEGDPVALNTVTPVEGLKLYGKWNKAYATSYDMEAYAVSDGASKAGLETALTAAGYAYTNINGIDNGHTHNYIYDGMKYKTNDGDLSFNVNAGKLVIVKTGNLPANALTMYINGVADPTVFVGANEAVETHVNNYFYSEAEALYRLDIQASKGTCAIKAVTITDPFTVSFDANGGDDVASLNGTPSVTLPSASKGTDSFLGWFIGEDKIGDAGDSYIPTANVELVAHWEAVSTDARLASITLNPSTGVLSPAFDPEVVNYTYTMPYGTASVPQIVEATSVNANAQDPVIDAQAANWGDVAHIHGVAQSGDTKDYYIQMLRAPKDGVSIFKAELTSSTTAAYSGVYADADNSQIKLADDGANGYKFSGTSNFIKMALNGGKFATGDLLTMTYSKDPQQGELAIYENTTKIVGTSFENHTLEFTSGANDLTELFIRRTSDNNFNGWVSIVEVTRAMNPVLTAITIDERAGVIDPLDDKHFNVQIPYEADLANLTIVPTIAWNAPAAENSIVVNDGGAWVEGNNTYKLTDKDGDATTYTITVARDVLKHTVSFNTHGGSAVASVEVVHNEYLTAVPNDPSKEDYIFKHWSLTDGGEEVNITTVQITENKEFHAVWEAEPAGIKLFNGNVLNTTNFISAAATTIEINEVEYPCLVNFASNRSSLAGAKQGDLVMYSATTDAAKIKFDLYNANGSAKTAYVWLVEEGDDAATQLDAIEIAGETRVKTAYYEFNGTKNRTVYLTSGSKADIKVLQAKVIESGSAIKQFGDAGYTLKLNQGRIAAATTAPVQFEGATLTVSSEYSVLNSSNLATKSANSFNVTSPVIMHVERSGGKYYVYQDPADKGTLYSANADIELNATGTWYFSSENSGSAASFTLIRFDLPKAAKPVVADMDNVEYCQGSAIDELAVSATVSDGGTMLYQWYKDGDAISGAEAATYQPTADGEYYVVVVNTKADHQKSDPTQSNTITVTGHAGTAISGTTGAEDWPGADATISVEASGKNLSYAWYTCDDAMGTNPVAVEPAVNAAELDVTVGAADTYYKVVVSGDCGDAQEAIITVVARQAVDLQDVTGNMKWDFSKANDGSAAGSDLCTDEVLANVHGIVNNSDFTSDNIKATANKFASGKLQASMIKFHTTVAGSVIVKCSNTGNNKPDRYLMVNGVETELHSTNQTDQTYAEYVPAGDVVLTVGGDGNMFNFTSVEFKLDNDLEPARTDDWLAPGEMGTICIPQGAVAVGADIYDLVGKEPQYGKIVFETVKHMKPGKPYMFIAKGDRIDLILTDETPATAPDNSGAMKGTFTEITLTANQLENVYYFAQHALWSCVDLTATGLLVPANRAYVKMDQVEPIQDPTPAPGRVRMSLGVNGAPAVTTGVENAQMDNAPVKMIINGQLFILRGEKMYDVTGKLVK